METLLAGYSLILWVGDIGDSFITTASACQSNQVAHDAILGTYGYSCFSRDGTCAVLSNAYDAHFARLFRRVCNYS
jgi:hypothetical protein